MTIRQRRQRHDGPPITGIARRSLLLGAASVVVLPRVRSWADVTAPPSQIDLRHAAATATDDLIRNFWDGAAETGHIRPTWSGYATGIKPLPDPRGALWERAMLFNALFEYQQLTSDQETKSRLKADWRWVKHAFTAADLTQCGRMSHANWASDDTGWDSLYLLQAHEVSGDPDALGLAAAAVRSAYERWGDGALGGGLWYSDDRAIKSLYETALALAALEIFMLTHDPRFLGYAADSERWMRERLRRDDSLYYCTATAAGPSERDRPSDIHPGGSVTYLGGEMAISVLQTRLATVTGQAELRRVAQETASAVARRMVDANGVLLNDRDAWNDGYFAAQWARDVIGADGLEAETLKRTAVAIVARDRLPSGFYGPDWDGPTADSRWSRGPTRPEQIMTSASTATMIIAAAFLP
jgi:hypothetical protein